MKKCTRTLAEHFFATGNPLTVVEHLRGWIRQQMVFSWKIARTLFSLWEEEWLESSWLLRKKCRFSRNSKIDKKNKQLIRLISRRYRLDETCDRTKTACCAGLIPWRQWEPWIKIWWNCSLPKWLEFSNDTENVLPSIKESISWLEDGHVIVHEDVTSQHMGEDTPSKLNQEWRERGWMQAVSRL